MREKQFRKAYLRTVHFELTVAHLCTVVIENPRKEGLNSMIDQWEIGPGLSLMHHCHNFRDLKQIFQTDTVPIATGTLFKAQSRVWNGNRNLWVPPPNNTHDGGGDVPLLALYLLGVIIMSSWQAT